MALGAVLTGCSLQDHIDTVSEKIERDYVNVKTWDELPLRVISWEQAIAMMKKNNSDLLDAESAIRKAERETTSVYTDMIPGLSYYSYFTRSINGLSDAITPDDISTNINMTFAVPTLTQIPYRVYAAKARAFAAIKAKEGKQRELESQLYKLVRLHEIEEKIKAHKDKQPSTPSDTPAYLAKDETDTYWKNVAEILGNYEARWQILPSSAPHVKWADYWHKLDKLDPLVVCHFALKLEQARMAQYSVALSYLPTINTSLYSPSLFSSSGGTYEGTFLDGEETRINLSISYSLDTQLRTWNQYENSKDRFESTKRKVVVDMIDHKNKMHQLRESIGLYNHWRKYMQKRINFVRSTPTSTSTEFLAKEKALHDMQLELLTQEKAAVDSEAAVVLEYGTPRTKGTTK